MLLKLSLNLVRRILISTPMICAGLLILFFSNSSHACMLKPNTSDQLDSKGVNSIKTNSSDWNKVVSESAGKEVNFYAWGGSLEINAYIDWVSACVLKNYGVKLNHIKISDTSEAVALILAENQTNHAMVSNKQEKIASNSPVDLIWINGQNFATLKQQDMLLESWITSLPNLHWVNIKNNPQMLADFGLDTSGSEAPWGQSNLLFYYNQRILNDSDLPQDAFQLLDFVKKYPNRFTYPKPPDFLGVSFIKQLLLQLNPNDTRVYQSVNSKDFTEITGSLWNYLDSLHPYLFKKGRYFPLSNPQMLRLFDEEQIILAMTFSGGSILSAKERHDLPETTAIYAMQQGSLSNVHFLAIPKDSANHDAAKVVVNFLLSPESQARKQNLQYWGDKTVLDLNEFDVIKPYFDEKSLNVMPAIQTPLAELHPSWSKALSDEWLRRYGQYLN